MNEIDKKLRERLRMIDEIDKMVKEPSQNSGGNEKSNHYGLKNNLNINLNSNINSCLTKEKAVDRYSNTDLSDDFDYPLQYNSRDSKAFGSTGNKPTAKKFFLNHNNSCTNSSLNEKLVSNQIQNSNSSNYTGNFYSLNGQEVNSTKEFTEPVIAKNKQNTSIKIGKKERESGVLSLNHSKTKFNSNQRDQRDKSPRKLVNINININNQNRTSTSPVGERLFKYGLYVKDKIERKKSETESQMMRKMTPEISTKAKSIQRDPKKCYERLYPYHKVNSKQAIDTNLKLNPSEGYNMNYIHDLNNEDMGIHITPNFDSNNKSIDEKNTNKIYRRVPSSQGFVIPFEHKPKLDKNSLKIAEHLLPSKERLLIKRPKRGKSKDKNTKSNISFDNSGSRTPRTPRTPTPSKRNCELYSLGLENMKKRELVHNQKKILDDQEFKKYTYKPEIIQSPHIITGRRNSSKSPTNCANKSSDDINPSQKSSKLTFYDKNLRWKKNVDSRKEKMKLTHEQTIQENLTFKPSIIRDLPINDEKFINKNLDQIEEYVNKRRKIIENKKQEEEYKKKKFITGENYKGTPTVAKEFNLQTDRRNRSRSFDRNKNRNFYTDVAYGTSGDNVSRMRKDMKTREFFENEVLTDEVSINYEYNNEQIENPDGSNINEFMDAINNLHSQLVNFKI